MSWNGPQSGSQTAFGQVASARQQKRTQSQARFNEQNVDDQKDGWFGQRDKPAKATRIDIVTHYQQALQQGNVSSSGACNASSSYTASSGMGKQAPASVTMELMAKQQRQREAKEQAEAAQRRRADALRAAKEAEDEYRLAREAERLAFQDGDSAAAPPPPPEETLARQGAQSQPTEQAQAHQTQATMQSPATTATVDVSQDEVLLEWSHSSDELKRQWAAWYMSNPSEWIEYKSQYTMNQQQQQLQHQSQSVSASHSQPQAVPQASPDNRDALQHAHTQMSQSQQQPAQSHSARRQYPEPFHQPSLQHQPPQQPSSWQQPPWQPQRYHEQHSYHQPGSGTQRQQWPVANPSQLAPRPAQPPVGTTADAPPAQALQQPHQSSAQTRPWANPTPPREAIHSQQPHQQPHQQPLYQDAAAEAAPPGTVPANAARVSSSPPWQSTQQLSAPVAHPPQTHEARVYSLPAWPSEHAASQAYGSWDGAKGTPGRGVYSAAPQPPPQHIGGTHPAAPRPVQPPELHHGEQHPAPDVATAPGPRNGYAGPPRRAANGADSAADQPHTGVGKQSPAQRHGADRPEGFLRGGRPKPRPPPPPGHNPWGAGSPAALTHGHGWRPAPNPTGPPGLGDGAPSAFGSDPNAAVHSSPQQSATAPQREQVPTSAPAAAVPQPHSPQQWPAQTAHPQRPLAADSSIPPTWHTHMAPRGPVGPPLRAADSGSTPAAPRPWQPRPPAQAPPPGGATAAAPHRWQLPPPAGAPRGNAAPAPLQGHPAAVPGSLGPPRPLAGGLSHAPPGVPKPADTTPPAIQQLQPPRLAQGQPQDVAALPPAPPVRSPVQPGGPFQGHSGASAMPCPRHEDGPAATMPTSSPPPRPGRLYGMHSPHASPGAPDPAGQQNGHVARLAPVQPNGMQFLPRGGAGAQPLNTNQGGNVYVRPYGSSPLPAEVLHCPGAPAMQARGPRPPCFVPGSQSVAGVHYQGLPPPRPQHDFVNGPRGPRGGPGMHGLPARPGLPYRSQFSPPRPSFL